MTKKEQVFREKEVLVAELHSEVAELKAELSQQKRELLILQEHYNKEQQVLFLRFCLDAHCMHTYIRPGKLIIRK